MSHRPFLQVGAGQPRQTTAREVELLEVRSAPNSLDGPHTVAVLRSLGANAPPLARLARHHRPQEKNDHFQHFKFSQNFTNFPKIVNTKQNRKTRLRIQYVKIMERFLCWRPTVIISANQLMEMQHGVFERCVNTAYKRNAYVSAREGGRQAESEFKMEKESNLGAEEAMERAVCVAGQCQVLSDSSFQPPTALVLSVADYWGSIYWAGIYFLMSMLAAAVLLLMGTMVVMALQMMAPVRADSIYRRREAHRMRAADLEWDLGHQTRSVSRLRRPPLRTLHWNG